MNLSDFVTRADELLGLADRVIASYRMGQYGHEVDNQLYGTFRSAGLSFLSNTFGESHPYFREFQQHTAESYKSSLQRGRGIIVASREEVAGGWAVTARGIISAEIFSDFLEMAEYLLDEGYKDPAAVVAGSVLEEHLRQLAKKHDVSAEVSTDGKTASKKADALNADLVKAGAYGKLEQKIVTAWLDLRNKAAHGRYSEYTKDQVGLMLQGVSQFMSQFAVVQAPNFR